MDDYYTGHLTCTATQALDARQAVVHKTDKAEREKGLNPDRPRVWMTWTADEGMPDFDEGVP